MKRSPIVLATAAFPLVVAPACGDTEGPPATTRIDTVGTRIEVTNTGAPNWPSNTAWTLEEDLRLGTAQTSSGLAEQFGSVRSIMSDSRGRIFVLDGFHQEIRVFDDTGAYSHTIGRRGEGPSEFDGASEVDVGRGDTLTVLDDGLMRFSVFAPDGSVVANHRRDIVGTGPSLRTVLDDGGYLDWSISFPDGRFGERLVQHPIRYHPGFERADTFPPIEFHQRMVASGRMPVLDFASTPVVSADRQGTIWFAHSHEYRIFRWGLSGDTSMAFSLAAEPVPLGEADRDVVRGRWSNRPDLQAEQLDGLPRTKPIIYGIVPDQAGHVYVFPDVTGEDPGTIVDVFRETGEYLGRLELPFTVPLESGRQPTVRATAEHLYVVVRDSLDVPYVARLRIRRGSG